MSKKSSGEVNQTYFIKAPVSKVFDALVNPKMLSRWFVKRAVLEPRKGGRYSLTELTYNDTQEGTVLEFRKNARLVIDWPK